jgi:hypothetical protein
MGLIRDLKKLGITAAQIKAAVQRKFTGPGVTDLGHSVSIAPPAPPAPPQQHAWVEIVSQLSGDGAYSCIVGRPRSDLIFDPASDGAEFDFFDFTAPVGGSGFNAYFVNQAEENKTPHWLDNGGHYFGFFVGRATDGYPIYLAHAFDTQLCEDA